MLRLPVPLPFPHLAFFMRIEAIRPSRKVPYGVLMVFAALLTLGVLRLVTAILSSRLGVTIHFLTPWEAAAFAGFAILLGFAGALWSTGSLLKRTG